MINHRLALPLVALLAVSCSAQKKEARLGPTPGVFRVQFETSKGDFVVEVKRELAPHGADRFYELVARRFYDGCRFFRVLRGFVVQWGINGDPAVQRQWVSAMIPDDPVKATNKPGAITYAKSGPNTRTTQVFINLVDNARLDKSGFAPFGEVVSGMEVLERFYSDYGEGRPRGNGPAQDMIQKQGNEYLEREFPRLDYIKRATLLK